MISKVSYIIDVEIEHNDNDNADKKGIISRTRQSIKRVIFDSPDAVKPAKIQIKTTK